MMDKRKRKGQSTVDMTEGVIWKQLLAFSAPLLAGNLFQQLYNTVDSAVVGNFVGTAALGAVTSTVYCVNAMIGLFQGFSSGAGVVISQYFGARDTDGVRRSIHTSILGTALLGIAMTILGILLVPLMIRLMSTPADIRADAEIYLRIYFTGISGLMLYNISSAVLRAVGDSRRPLYFLIFCTFLNIALDLLFVAAFHCGVAGAALATILSQFISAGMTLALLFRSREVYGISWKEMRIDPAILRDIIRIGFPAGFQLAITSFSNVFVMSYINSFGADSTAGWGIYRRVDEFSLLPTASLALAVTTFVGQNAGAGNTDRIRKGVRQGNLIGFLITAGLSGIVFACSGAVVPLFTKEKGAIDYGILYLRLNCLFDILGVQNQVYAGALRGVGNARVPMLIMLFSFVFFRQGYLLVCSRFFRSVYTIGVCYPVGWLICSILMALYFRFTQWELPVHQIAAKENGGREG